MSDRRKKGWNMLCSMKLLSLQRMKLKIQAQNRSFLSLYFGFVWKFPRMDNFLLCSEFVLGFCKHLFYDKVYDAMQLLLLWRKLICNFFGKNKFMNFSEKENSAKFIFQKHYVKAIGLRVKRAMKHVWTMYIRIFAIICSNRLKDYAYVSCVLSEVHSVGVRICTKCE